MIRTTSEKQICCSCCIEQSAILFYTLTTTIMYAEKKHAPILYNHPETPGSYRIPDAQGPCSGNRTCPAYGQICAPPLKGERLNHREVQLPRRKTDALLPKHACRNSTAGIRLKFFLFQSPFILKPAEEGRQQIPVAPFESFLPNALQQELISWRYNIYTENVRKTS